MSTVFRDQMDHPVDDQSSFSMQNIILEANMSSTTTTTEITASATEKNEKKKAGFRGLYDRAPPPTHSGKWKGKQH